MFGIKDPKPKAKKKYEEIPFESSFGLKKSLAS